MRLRDHGQLGLRFGSVEAFTGSAVTVPGDHGTHGTFDDRANSYSTELWLEMNRKWLGAGLGLLAAGLLFRLLNPAEIHETLDCSSDLDQAVGEEELSGAISGSTKPVDLRAIPILGLHFFNLLTARLPTRYNF